MAKQQKHESLTIIERAWREAVAHDLQHRSDHLDPGSEKFIDYAWKKYDSKTVMHILASNKSSYKALKPILFSGLCAWVVCPNRSPLRRQAMLLVGIEHLRRAEEIGRAAFAGHDIPDHDLLGDTMGRLRELGRDFYSDFYYPVGGLSQFISCVTPAEFVRNLQRHTKDIRIIVSMMQVFDFHLKHLHDKARYYPASDSKGFELIRDIHGIARKEIKIDLKKMSLVWKEYKSTLSMIYAASTISVDDNENLLEAISIDEVSYEQHGHLVELWFGRARYAAEVILGSSTRQELKNLNVSFICDITPVPTPEPHFSKVEQERIEGEFNIGNLLGGRQPGKRRERKSRRGSRRG